MDIIDTAVPQETISAGITAPAVDIATYHRAVEALRIRDELESSRIEAAEFRIRLDGMSTSLKQVTSERDRARSDVEQQRTEMERLRTDYAVAKTQATERAAQVDVAMARAEDAEEALRQLQLELAAQPVVNGAVSAAALTEEINGPSPSRTDVTTGNVFSRMVQELRRLGAS